MYNSKCNLTNSGVFRLNCKIYKLDHDNFLFEGGHHIRVHLLEGSMEMNRHKWKCLFLAPADYKNKAKIDIVVEIKTFNAYKYRVDSVIFSWVFLFVKIN